MDPASRDQKLRSSFHVHPSSFRTRHLTRMPGWAPESRGDSREDARAISRCGEDHALATPNFILRGARFPTTTVSRPRVLGIVGRLDAGENVAGAALADVERQLRSLSAPSTCSAATIWAMRRSTFEKSSIVIALARLLRRRGASPTAAGRGGGCRASNSATICFASTRCSRCL